MENDIERSITGLITSGGDAATAAAEVGDSIKLLQNPASEIRAETDALILATEAVANINQELASRRTTLRQVLNDSRGLLKVSREVLKPVFGDEPNESWTVLGFTDSLVIPLAAEEVQLKLRFFKDFFTAHPEREVDPLDVTASKFDELHINLAAARAAFRQQQLLLKNTRVDRDTKAQTLRKRLRDLFWELTMRLDPLSPLWETFGFNRPGAQATPDVPENVVVTLNGSDAAMKWKAAPRAEYYHAWKKVVGVDKEPVLVGSPADLDFTFDAFPANATIELAVSAVNNGGESQPSEVVVVKTP